MRRTDRDITADTARVTDILDRARVLRLALNDGPRPYIVPMHYGYTLENGTLTFWLHCAKEGHKLDLLRADPNAAFELDCDIAPVSGGDVPCTYGSAYASVMGFGTAAVVDDPAEKIAALQTLMHTQTGREFVLTEQMAQSVCVLRLTVSEYTAKSRPLPKEV